MRKKRAATERPIRSSLHCVWLKLGRYTLFHRGGEIFCHRYSRLHSQREITMACVALQGPHQLFHILRYQAVDSIDIFTMETARTA